jgi:hypothetical protein
MTKYIIDFVDALIPVMMGVVVGLMALAVVLTVRDPPPSAAPVEDTGAEGRGCK